MLGHPGDALVELDHPVLEGGDLHVPGAQRLVDQRLVRAPAMRIVVVIRLVTQDHALLLEVADDFLVGVEHVHAGIGRDELGEVAGEIDGIDDRDALLLADAHVVLAEGGSDVHDASTVGHLDEVAADDAESAVRLLRGEEGQHRLIGAADELDSLQLRDLDITIEFLGVVADQRRADDQTKAILLQHGVVGVGRDRERHVGRQRPGRGRPGEKPRRDIVALDGVKQEADRQGRVLTHAVGIVEAGLEVRQRRLRGPAIGHDAIALIDQALFVQLLERPHDALHEGEVHGLVVVLEIDPARRTRDIVFPVRRELLDGAAAMLVEAGDAVFQDLDAARDAELLLGLHLGRQAVAIPAETAIDHLAAHGLVARHQILDETGDEVAVMRQAVGEGRAVIEDELGRALVTPLLDRAFEDLVFLPPGTDRFLDLRERGRRLGGGINGLRLCHDGCLYSGRVRERNSGLSIAPLRHRRHP